MRYYDPSDNSQGAPVSPNYGKYSVIAGVCGLILLMFFFPTGMYMGFFCGAVGLACGVVAKRASGRASVPGIILCALSLGLSLFYYITLLGFYEVIRDPVYGRQWTQLFTQILTQSGLSLEQFSRIMAP